ncbi:hypothetical protein AAFF_G00032310 [Aldrovandia affinis]|uniref:Uncharacterized protein n=1 Tax=Aldrovandia affinis TaxID=143900 RepID=A0AAD7S490_9TELE|nr:hypothetical protein AAFF_G00032310 [Aldrovandia affinis]
MRSCQPNRTAQWERGMLLSHRPAQSSCQFLSVIHKGSKLLQHRGNSFPFPPAERMAFTVGSEVCLLRGIGTSGVTQGENRPSGQNSGYSKGDPTACAEITFGPFHHCSHH